MKARGLAGLIVLSTIVMSAPVGAQSSLVPAPEPNSWQGLSPDARQQMRRRFLESLTPAKRQRLRSQVKRFNAMTTAKQQELCRSFEKDRGYLPPACQKLFP